MAETAIGKVVHWYDKVGVAVVHLNGVLKVGDRLKIKRGDEEFEDAAASLQLDHKPVSSGNSGDEVAVKLSKKAREGAQIFKIE